MVGLAFNTKTLAGLVVVPGIALAYLLCAPGRLSRRIIHLLAAALLMVLLGGAWIAFVELTPASERPYVGGSTNNTELNLTFGYNGFGRVEGQKGGPDQITLTNLPRELLHRREMEALPAEEARNAELLGVAHRAAPPSRSAARPAGPAAGAPPAGAPRRAGLAPGQRPSATTPVRLPDGRLARPIAFGAAVGPLRMFEVGLDTQGGWLVPFAFGGFIAMALLVALTARRAAESAGGGSSARGSARRDVAPRGPDRARRILPGRVGSS